MSNYLLLLGSLSDLKRDVCDAAIRLSRMNVDVLQLDVKSHIPEQPYGEIEISAGAVNRSLATLRMYRNMLRSKEIEPAPPGTIILAGAIENGLLPELVRSDRLIAELVTLDRGCLVICTPRLKDPIKVYSDGVVVPPELVIEAVETHNQEVTAGKLEAARTPGCDHRDPHKVWSKGKTSRSALLIPAMLNALKQVELQL